MLPLSLLQVQDRPSIGQIMPIAHAERAWTADVAHRRDIFLDIDDATNREIRAAMEFVRANGLNLQLRFSPALLSEWERVAEGARGLMRGFAR